MIVTPGVAPTLLRASRPAAGHPPELAAATQGSPVEGERDELRLEGRVDDRDP